MSYEYAGTLYTNVGDAQRASIEHYLHDGVNTDYNYTVPSSQLADEIIEVKWNIPEFDGDRDDLIALIDEVKEERSE